MNLPFNLYTVSDLAVQLHHLTDEEIEAQHKKMLRALF